MTSREALIRLHMLSAYLTGARSDWAPLMTSSTLRLPWTSLAVSTSPPSAKAAEAKRSSSLSFHFMTSLQKRDLRPDRRRSKALAVLAAKRLRSLAAAGMLFVFASYLQGG